MANAEKTIIDALIALNIFTKVRYLVIGADNENQPEVLPWAVLTDGGRDFGEFATMCGSDTVVQSMELTIMANSASEARTLADAAIGAIKSLAAVESSVDSYDSTLRAYQCDITLTV